MKEEWSRKAVERIGGGVTDTVEHWYPVDLI